MNRFDQTFTAEATFNLTDADARGAKPFKVKTQVLFEVHSDEDADPDQPGGQLPWVTHKPEVTGFRVLLYGKWQDPGDVLHDMLLHALVQDDEWLMDAARQEVDE
jgi:hypothetical protein